MPHYLKRVKVNRARQNAAVEFDGITFHDVNDLITYKKAMGLAGEGYFEPPYPEDALPPARKRLGERRKKKTRTAKRSSAPRNPNGPVSPKQGRIIGFSVGKMAAYCPALVQERSHWETLTSMGLTSGRASEVISAMDAAGVLRPHRGVTFSKAHAKKALAILTRVGGVSCEL